MASTRPARKRTRPIRVAPTPDPLSAWRRLAARDLDRACITQIREALAGTLMLHHRRWPAASRFDAAAAVGIALDLTDDTGPAGIAGDLAMSALLIHAARGNQAARLVLARALVQASQAPDGSPELFGLALGWARHACDMGPPTSA